MVKNWFTVGVAFLYLCAAIASFRKGNPAMGVFYLSLVGVNITQGVYIG